MLTISASKITGKQLFRIVEKAVKDRVQNGHDDSISSFCRAAGISRTSLYYYRYGERPRYEGIFKVAQGLGAWGVEVAIKA